MILPGIRSPQRKSPVTNPSTFVKEFVTGEKAWPGHGSACPGLWECPRTDPGLFRLLGGLREPCGLAPTFARCWQGQGLDRGQCLPILSELGSEKPPQLLFGLV